MSTHRNCHILSSTGPHFTVVWTTVSICNIRCKIKILIPIQVLKVLGTTACKQYASLLTFCWWWQFMYIYNNYVMSTCTTFWEPKSNFWGLLSKFGKDLWDCEIAMYCAAVKFATLFRHPNIFWVVCHKKFWTLHLSQYRASTQTWTLFTRSCGRVGVWPWS